MTAYAERDCGRSVDWQKSTSGDDRSWRARPAGSPSGNGGASSRRCNSFYPRCTYSIPQNLIYKYFKELAAKSARLLVVNQNDEVGARVEVETLVLLSIAPGIIGVKGYMSFNQLQQCFRRADRSRRFAVMSGDAYLYGAALLLGIGHFTMGGPGNVCPRWYTSIFRRALDNDWAAISKRQRRLTEFCDALHRGMDTAYAAIKYALKCLGVCFAHISSPTASFRQNSKNRWNEFSRSMQT